MGNGLQRAGWTDRRAWSSLSVNTGPAECWVCSSSLMSKSSTVHQRFPYWTSPPWPVNEHNTINSQASITVFNLWPCVENKSRYIKKIYIYYTSREHLHSFWCLKAQFIVIAWKRATRTFFKLSQFVFHCRKIDIWIWDNLRASKPLWKRSVLNYIESALVVYLKF